jgi:hypothetical protein
MSAEFDLRPDDLVIIRLTLRGRDGGAAVNVNETPTVADLGLGQDAPTVEPPTLDTAEYARLLSAGGSDAEAALRMLAEFNEATADFMAAGGTPPAESLAQAVVDWVVETRPGGHKFVTTDSADGYVISAREINIHQVSLGDDDRAFRVTAVGTWG